MAREGEVREQHYGLRAQKRPLPGTRPAPLLEVLPQLRVQRHAAEQIGDSAPFLPSLDVPMPLMGEQLVVVNKLLDDIVPEQVIVVPRISCSPCPSRSPIPEPQSAEQLVEMPTVLSPTRIALQIAEQIVDTPVPRGRGEGRVQGFLPRQSSTATPSSVERISERIEEQLVDTSPGGLGQGSSSSAGAADEDFTGFSHVSPK